MQVLKGDEDLLLISNGTLAPFWHAIDMVKKRGYSLEHFREPGAGSQVNPTRVYAIKERYNHIFLIYDIKNTFDLLMKNQGTINHRY